MENKEIITVEEFAALLIKHISKKGCSWNNVPLKVEPKAEHDYCECCDSHPLTQINADRATWLFNKLRELDSVPPWCLYVHCEEETIVEWISDDYNNRCAIYFADRNIIFSWRNKDANGRDHIFYELIYPEELQGSGECWHRWQKQS